MLFVCSQVVCPGYRYMCVTLLKNSAIFNCWMALLYMYKSNIRWLRERTIEPLLVVFLVAVAKGHPLSMSVERAIVTNKPLLHSLRVDCCFKLCETLPFSSLLVSFFFFSIFIRAFSLSRLFISTAWSRLSPPRLIAIARCARSVWYRFDWKVACWRWSSRSDEYSTLRVQSGIHTKLLAEREREEYQNSVGQSVNQLNHADPGGRTPARAV